MYCFIINPHAKSGTGYKVWKKIEKLLRLSQVEYQARLTERPGQAAEIAADWTKGCKEPKVIVIVGGDGTVNEVVDGLSFCNTITLGYIPVGSGCDLARSLRLPRSPRRCLKKILHPKYHKLVDYGVITYGDEVIHHRRFVVSAGMGLDAAVCHNLLYSWIQPLMNRLHLTRAAFLLVGLKQILRAKPVKGYILLDGIKKVEFNYIYFISAQIHPSEGSGFYFAPGADCSDGYLEVCVASHASKTQLFPLLLKAMLRHPRKNRRIRQFQCREATIHTERPVAVHVDGESCLYQREVEIRCIERKIRMIV